MNPSCTATEEVLNAGEVGAKPPEGNDGEVGAKMTEENAGEVDAKATEVNADEVAVTLPEGDAGEVALQLPGGVCSRNEKKGEDYLPQLMLGFGIGAITLGIGEVISPPSDGLFKHWALMVAFYATQVVEMILGVVQLIVFIRWLKTAGLERRQWHQMGKVVLILTLLPVLVTITLVNCAKFI